ncbi:MAG: hypothetical protein CMJ81_24720 [Planctomycetaceae bacterium]|jgi:hypothetical protein|nr:hypothetical protein [Planctomycetaceae bacterium]MBP61287.1 hypothetical protein [Planctomycetaceae bacterium]
MSTLPTADSVRDIIRKTFRKLGADSQQSMLETILIRDGHFCGRRYSHEDRSAVWFVEENEIKFYDFKGSVVKTISATSNKSGSGERAA